MLYYEANPKHTEPWQRGKKGSMCPPMPFRMAVKLLRGSSLSGKKRFMVFEGCAYAGQMHQVKDGDEYWHGYPVGWNEVPPKLCNEWIKADPSLKRKIKRT